MNYLDQLAIYYNTDKASNHHNYTKIYNEIFEKRRDDIKGVIELGIMVNENKKKYGSSLQMWRDYFPYATVVGIDKDPKTQIDYGERIIAVLGNQISKTTLDKACSLLPQIDIIIDDASHINLLTINTFEYLFKKLSPGGYYVIEDTLCGSEFNRFGNNRRDLEYFILNILKYIELNGLCATPANMADFKRVDPDIVLNYFQKYIESIYIERGIYIIKKRIL